MKVSYLNTRLLFVIVIFISSQIKVSAQNNEVIDLESLEEIQTLSKIIYGKLVILDNNDKNLTQIVNVLNNANSYYEKAKNDLNIGNEEEFRTYVTNYLELLRKTENSIDLQITNMKSENNKNVLQALFLSILYVFLGYIAWKFILKNYKNKILKYQPLVSNIEAE